MLRASIFSKIGLLASGALVLPSLFACLDHPLKPVEYDKAQEEKDNIALTVNKDVDILFIIDNSGSMGAEQATLSDNFGGFISVLEDPTVEANYRLGVTTTDNGNPWCAGTTPEGGALRLSPCTQRLEEFIFQGTDPPTDEQTACTDFCTLTDIPISGTETDNDRTPKARPWLENIEGLTNLPDGVSTLEAFQCFGPQGINGCGFESHLESMYKGLRRAEDANEASFDFFRSNAILSIIFVTDEADCSHNNDWQTIFLAEGNKVFWSDPNAAFPSSAVCWNAGVSCVGGPGTYTECNSEKYDVDKNPGASDAAAVLHPINRYTDLVQTMENGKQSLNPNQEAIVAVIGGVPQGYVDGQDIVYQDTAEPDFQGNYGIGPGCSSAAGEAVPPVRLREFAEAFEVNGERNLYSVCAVDYTPALNAIATAIADQVKPACMPACVADSDAASPTLDPSCFLTERVPTENGLVSETMTECTLLCGGGPCAVGNRPNADGWEMPADVDACYRMLIDDGSPNTASPDDNMQQECIDDGWNLEFVIERREGKPAVGGTAVEATCELSAAPEVDCPNL